MSARESYGADEQSGLGASKIDVVRAAFDDCLAFAKAEHAATYAEMASEPASTQDEIDAAKKALFNCATIAYGSFYNCMVKVAGSWFSGRDQKSFAKAAKELASAYDSFFDVIEQSLRNCVRHMSSDGVQGLQLVECITQELVVEVKQHNPDASEACDHLAYYLIPTMRTMREEILARQVREGVFDIFYCSVFIELMQTHLRSEDGVENGVEFFAEDDALTPPNKNPVLIAVLSIVPVLLLLLIPLTRNYRKVTEDRERYRAQLTDWFRKQLQSMCDLTGSVRRELQYSLYQRVMSGNKRVNPFARQRLALFVRRHTKVQRVFSQRYGQAFPGDTLADQSRSRQRVHPSSLSMLTQQRRRSWTQCAPVFQAF